jgi:ATP-dependent RNA helicase SUPV3L1/SUV3
VAFSRNDIFAIKREIESTTPHKCCVVYGSLPPATRSEQARRFNDPDSGYDILVASDAIGMGLNLNIKRVILNSIFKYDGTGIIRLGHSAMKQISGRAGRRNSPFPQGGTSVVNQES